MKPICFALLSAFLMIAAGCSDDARPASEQRRSALEDKSQTALREMQAKDIGLRDFLNDAYAYAIFPEVGKGGLIAGGAFGRGIVREQGQPVGWAEIQQASIGAQAGGQTFSELLVFKNRDTFRDFQNNQLSLGANASAVILKAGASKTAQFDRGVAVLDRKSVV